MRVCPLCGSKSRVLETRDAGETTRRRRQCSDEDCEHKFTTHEVYDLPPLARMLAGAARAWVGAGKPKPADDYSDADMIAEDIKEHITEAVQEAVDDLRVSLPDDLIDRIRAEVESEVTAQIEDSGLLAIEG